MRFETLAVHAGAKSDPETGAIAPPIHLATTFEHTPEGAPTGGYVYIRDSNPTQDRLEDALAAVEGGEAALAFASGVGAGAALLESLEPGSHVLFHKDIYYAFKSVARDYLPRWGMEASFADLRNAEEARAALRPNTRLLWVETPTNPMLEILDLARLASLARERGARLLVDGTFATPALQQPIALGADVVLHSTTKYLGGHSDVHGGALVFAKRDALFEGALKNRHLLGAVASPFASWLVLRGLRTLSCRMERQSANAMAVATALEGHPALSAVLYPGLPSHPGHAVAASQMRAFGGMMSLRLKGGRAAAIGAASRVKIFTNATSLGGVESLLEHRASMEDPATTTPDDLLRVSIGLEHPDDLIEDLRGALS
ncbi:MAG TPA: aminotransferase class I/II-fold pyridoxal phosphate-dependent enzyme [Candidatus Eisenbacteria bacterium]|nr:aminotransferase class I/II-fold pyridoxal phosphate-dependent enzyme [Candidatus Eisenbacteria bacterium]